MKRFIFIALAITFCLAGKASVWTDANGTTWTFTTSGSNATLKKMTNGEYVSCISGTIPNDLVIPSVVYVGSTPYNVTSIGNSAFVRCSSLTSINIPEGVTSIGACTFQDCARLTSINIPNTVNSIGGYTFQNCSNLTSINIPNGVTSIQTYTFNGCI